MANTDGDNKRVIRLNYTGGHQDVRCERRIGDGKKAQRCSGCAMVLVTPEEKAVLRTRLEEVKSFLGVEFTCGHINDVEVKA